MNAAYQYTQKDVAWASLGLNYVIGVDSWNPLEDPENLIIHSLNDFIEDPRLLSMVLAWAREYDALIHVERLAGFIKDLDSYQLAVLGSLAKKLSDNPRWNRLHSLIVQKIGKHRPQFQTPEIYSRLARIQGVDLDFKEFGIEIPKVKFADTKKLKPIEVIASYNHWFRFRALIDSHMRADTAVTIILLNLTTAYQVEKYLRCSRETAYRQFKSLKQPYVEQQLRSLI